MTIARAAEALGVSQKTVRRWIAAGKLPAQKTHGPYGEQYLVPAEAIQTAQSITDVVKVDRPTDPRTLAMAVSKAIEAGQLPILETLSRQAEALEALRAEAERQTAQAAALKSAIVAESQQRAEREAALLAQVEALTTSVEALRAQQERSERRRWWEVWKR